MPAKKAQTKIEIIYHDDDILVINKPASLSVTRDRTGAAELRDVLSRQLGPQTAGELRLVHRLDKDTSGVMILARNLTTQSLFSGYFARRMVKKTYLAFVAGVLTAGKDTIDVPLAPRGASSALMCVATKKGKQAVTNWRLLADFGSIALLAVSPLTGRTHQIRVHLASVGLPLAIDTMYGAAQPLFLSDFKLDYRLAKGQTEKPLIDRLTLHAYQIQLLQPQPHRPDCFIAPLDKEFTACLKMLTKHNPKGLEAFTDLTDFSKILNTHRL